MATSTYSANPISTNTPTGAPTAAPSVTGTGVDPLALQKSVADLLGFQSEQATLDAAAAGSALTAQGAQVEADAYGMAAGIATGNQQSEAIFEGVRQTQIMRGVDKTVGGIRADVAGNGFAQSGSALDLMRSSYSQGYLAEQISGMQSEQVQRGYMEQAAAANGEMTAAQTRALAAQELSTAQSSASATSKANQAAMTDALTKLLAGDPNAQKLVNDLMAGDVAGAEADALLYNPNGAGEPLGTGSGSGGAGSGGAGPVNPFSTNPNRITVTPTTNVMLGQALGVYGLVSGSKAPVGQANNILGVFNS